MTNERVCEDPANCFTCDGHGCNNVDVNTLTLPDAPGAGVVNVLSTSVLMVLTAMLGLQMRDLF